jgi:hypothetical protein
LYYLNLNMSIWMADMIKGYKTDCRKYRI